MTSTLLVLVFLTNSDGSPVFWTRRIAGTGAGTGAGTALRIAAGAGTGTSGFETTDGERSILAVVVDSDDLPVLVRALLLLLVVVASC